MILIISQSIKDAYGLADMFYYMGVLAKGTDADGAFSEISPLYKAVIIMNPSFMRDKCEYVNELRGYSGAPFFAVTDHPDARDRLLFDGVIGSTAYALDILNYITESMRDRKGGIPGSYVLGEINASISIGSPTLCGVPLRFTKTEAMILRTLIVAYPTPTVSRDILKYAFRQTRMPELSNIRTHISVMNKKARECAERNLIELLTGEGYKIAVPEASVITAK